MHGVDEQEGLLVVHDVAADFLAEGFGVAPHVEHVVAQLEGETHVDASLIEEVGLGVVAVGDEGSRLEGTAQQDRGLETNHVDILLDGDIVAVLVVHVPLLAFINLDGCLVEQVHDGPAGTARNVLCGDGQHGVAAQDGSVVVPATVHSGFAASHVGVVHHVIVQEREVVEHFQAHGCVNRHGRVAAHGVTGHECEHGTYTFAPQSHVVADGLVELTGRCRVGDGSNRLIDGVEIFLKGPHCTG